MVAMNSRGLSPVSVLDAQIALSESSDGSQRLRRLPESESTTQLNVLLAPDRFHGAIRYSPIIPEQGTRRVSPFFRVESPDTMTSNHSHGSEQSDLTSSADMSTNHFTEYSSALSAQRPEHDAEGSGHAMNMAYPQRGGSATASRDEESIARRTRAMTTRQLAQMGVLQHIMDRYAVDADLHRAREEQPLPPAHGAQAQFSSGAGPVHETDGAHAHGIASQTMFAHFAQSGLDDSPGGRVAARRRTARPLRVTERASRPLGTPAQANGD